MSKELSAGRLDLNRLRRARRQKGYTLKQVAELTGYSVGYISQLERNQKQPSLTALRKIAACLECSEVWLIMGEYSEDGSRSCSPETAAASHDYVMRREDRIPMRIPEIDVDYSIFTPSSLPGGNPAQMTGLLVRLKSGCWVTERMISHAKYDESLFLLQGELELHVDTRIYRIRPGDSFYIPQNTLHNYLNLSEEEAVCLVYFSKLIY